MCRSRCACNCTSAFLRGLHGLSHSSWSAAMLRLLSTALKTSSAGDRKLLVLTGWGCSGQVTERDRRKLADKDRKLQEKAIQQKVAALADDDNVFDVAFEQQGEGAATASATDIQVCTTCPLILSHKRMSSSQGCRSGHRPGAL